MGVTAERDLIADAERVCIACEDYPRVAKRRGAPGRRAGDLVPVSGKKKLTSGTPSVKRFKGRPCRAAERFRAPTSFASVLVENDVLWKFCRFDEIRDD